MLCLFQYHCFLLSLIMVWWTFCPFHSRVCILLTKNNILWFWTSFVFCDLYLHRSQDHLDLIPFVLEPISIETCFPSWTFAYNTKILPEIRTPSIVVAEGNCNAFWWVPSRIRTMPWVRQLCILDNAGIQGDALQESIAHYRACCGTGDGKNQIQHCSTHIHTQINNKGDSKTKLRPKS